MPPGPPDEPYRVYTRAYDRELRWHEVDAALGRVSPDPERGYLSSRREWKREIERRSGVALDSAGDLDSLRARIAATVSPGGTAVSLLVDQSGSMRGERMATVAALVDWLSDVLVAAGARTEILGFSTAGWRGGFAYRQWLEAGRPPRPGRLCALMHVVYKIADEETMAGDARKVMLHPDLLRENVDGEAIAWAAARLAALPEPNKWLVVLSDGAPVDDATLMYNGAPYLERHIVKVIAQVEQEGEVRLGAIGVEHAVDRYYSRSTEAATLADLPAAAAELFEKLARVG